MKKSMIGFLFLLLFPFVVQASSIVVSYDANTEEDLAGYRIYYGTQSGVYGAPIDVGNSTSYTIGNAGEKVTYYVAVTAYDTSGNESEYSEEAFITMPAVLPGTPAIPTLTAGQKELTIAWVPSGDAVSYKIYYGTASGVYGSPITATGSSYTLTGLIDNTTYFVALTALGEDGDESLKSAEASVKLLDTTKPTKPGKPRLSIWEKISQFLQRLFG